MLPAGYPKTDLVAHQWDEILRFIATIRLKEATASQLFKRLNSYSRQHPRYQALKEFGKIPTSAYLLRFTDMLELRQAVEKQLNKGENVNKFARAISFGNNQEFLDGDKVEQEMAEGRRRLIKNAIICWNYLYLTQKIADAESVERRQELSAAVRHGSMASWGMSICMASMISPMTRSRILWGYKLPKFWGSIRPQVCRALGHPETPEPALQTLGQQLETAYQQTAANFPTNAAVRIEAVNGRDTLTEGQLRAAAGEHTVDRAGDGRDNVPDHRVSRRGPPSPERQAMMGHDPPSVP